MSMQLRTTINEKLGDSLYNKVKHYESNGAFWTIADDGIRLMTSDKKLLIWVKTDTIFIEEN